MIETIVPGSECLAALAAECQTAHDENPCGWSRLENMEAALLSFERKRKGLINLRSVLSTLQTSASTQTPLSTVSSSTKMKISTLLAAALATIAPFATVAVTPHKSCARVVMNDCKCKDWKCINAHIVTICDLPPRPVARKRYIQKTRNFISKDLCANQ